MPNFVHGPLNRLTLPTPRLAPSPPETAQGPNTLISATPVQESAAAYYFADPPGSCRCATDQGAALRDALLRVSCTPQSDAGPTDADHPRAHSRSPPRPSEPPRTFLRLEFFNQRAHPMSSLTPILSRQRGADGIRVVLLCIAALVVVLLIIGAIRLFSGKSQGSGPSEPPPTTVVTTTTSHTAASVDQAPLPIPSAELTQYEQYAQSLNAANITATKALTGKNAALTTTDVVPVATIYGTDLNTYSLELAFIEYWPASLETTVKADQAQLVIMAAYLKAVGSVSPTGLNSWLAELKAQASTTESLDNALRQELDLPKTTVFPMLWHRCWTVRLARSRHPGKN